MIETIKDKIVLIITYIFLILLSVFFLYKSLQDIVLIANHDKIEVTITDAAYHYRRRNSHYTYTFEYLIDNQTYESSIDVSWNLFSKLIHKKYQVGSIKTVYYNNWSKDFEDYVFSDLLSDITTFILFLVILSLMSSGSILKSGKYFYIQFNNYKIKKYSLLKMGQIEDHVLELEQNKIICFGFCNEKKYTEYSYADSSFYVRKTCKGTVNENIKEINREEVIEQSNFLRKKLIYKS